LLFLQGVADSLDGLFLIGPVADLVIDCNSPDRLPVLFAEADPFQFIFAEEAGNNSFRVIALVPEPGLKAKLSPRYI
jgi:hypothetical protein